MKWKLDSTISELQKIPFLTEYGIHFYIKRDDLIHPLISGNKSRKLKYYIHEFYSKNHDFIITFGGAFSNHLLAVAEACFDLKIPCMAFVRGEELNENSNSILAYCVTKNMQLIFIERNEYDAIKKEENIPKNEFERFHKNKTFQNPLIIPEGANTYLGSQGFDDIKNQIPFVPDYLITSVGSGATFTGLTNIYKDSKTKIIGIAALKKDKYLEELAIEKNQKIFFTDKGFGDFDIKTMQFIVDFYNEYQIILDPIYTAKTLQKILELTKENHFDKNDTLVFLHTGGITGLLSKKANEMLSEINNSAKLIAQLKNNYKEFIIQ